MRRRFKKQLSFFISVCIVVSMFLGATPSVYAAPGDNVSIRLLSHATFLLDDGAETIITDPSDWFYPDVYKLLGENTPTIATISHSYAGHEDHFNGWPSEWTSTQMIPGAVAQMGLTTTSAIVTGGSIKDFKTYHVWDLTGPGTGGSWDNAAFLYDLNGVKILHSGDMEGTIRGYFENPGDPNIQAQMDAIIAAGPDVILLNLTTMSPTNITTEAAIKFIDAVHPKVVIPMHWLNIETVTGFLYAINSAKIAQTETPYTIVDLNSDNVNVSAGSIGGISGPQIWLLEPQPVSPPPGGATPPVLTPAASATVDGDFNITFTDDPTWSAAINSVSVNGQPLIPSAYTTSAGILVLKPSASPSLQHATTGAAITITATGYNPASVSQPIGHGAVHHLAILQQPSTTTNGGIMTNQPVVAIMDQYNNICTTSVVNISAEKGPEQDWLFIGGKILTTLDGFAAYSDFTAVSSGAISGATIVFSAAGLESVTSLPFNIPAPDAGPGPGGEPSGDTTPPAIVAALGNGTSDPVIGQAPDTEQIIFSEALNTPSKMNVEIALSQAAPGASLGFAWSNGDTTLTITGATDRAVTFENDVTVTVADVAGNPASLKIVDSLIDIIVDPAVCISNSEISSQVKVQVDKSGGMLQVKLLKTDNSDELSSLTSVTTDTAFQIKFHVKGYTPRIAVGHGDIASFTIMDSALHSGYTEVTIDVKPISADMNRNITNMMDWTGYDTATDHWDLTISLAVDSFKHGEMTDAAADRFKGMYIATDSQAFSPPIYTNGQLSMFLAAPHFLIGGVTVNNGFFKAYLPATLLADWGITNTDQINVDYTNAGAEAAFTKEGSIGSGVVVGMTYHYSAGNVNIAPKADPITGYSIEGGSAAGAAKITYTPGEGSSLKYKKQAGPFTIPLKGSAEPEGLTSYTSGNNIAGCSAGEHIGLYELSGGNVVKFADITLQSSEIAALAPSLAGGLSFTDPAGYSNNGKTQIVLGVASVPGNTFKYLISSDSNPVPTPLVGFDASSWIGVANGALITAADGKNIGVAEVNDHGFVVQFSNAAAVVADESEPTTPPTSTPTSTPTPTSSTPPIIMPPVTTITPTPTPTPSAEPVVDNGAVKVEQTPELDEDTNTATAVISEETLEQALKLAEENNSGSTTLTFEVAEVDGAKEYVQVLPAAAFDSGTGGTTIKIETPLATISAPSNMFSSDNTGDAKNIGLSVGIADISGLSESIKKEIGDRPVIELSAQVDGSVVSWNNPEAPVTISFEYTPTEEELRHPQFITVWYIDGNGKAISVPNAHYDTDTGMITFQTTHFSKYAVVYNKVTFNDLQKYVWAKESVEVLASKGIIDGTSETGYSPEKSITRADFLVYLIRTLGLTAKFDSNFSDVKTTDNYYEALGIAKKLGITVGVGNNKFLPDTPILRQDIALMVERALKAAGKTYQKGSSADLGKFTDASGISTGAADSLAMLVKEGFLVGSGKRLYPNDNLTRAQTAVLLYRIYSKYNN